MAPAVGHTIKYGFRRWEARVFTVKTGLIFLYLFSYVHDGDKFCGSVKV